MAIRAVFMVYLFESRSCREPNDNPYRTQKCNSVVGVQWSKVKSIHNNPRCQVGKHVDAFLAKHLHYRRFQGRLRESILSRLLTWLKWTQFILICPMLFMRKTVFDLLSSSPYWSDLWRFSSIKWICFPWDKTADLSIFNGLWLKEPFICALLHLFHFWILK